MNCLQVSYGSILVPVGVGLLSYGFGAFFQLLPGSEVSALMLIYGFPVSVLGFALAYAQLDPVPCTTTREAYELRASQMTDIQKQIREDTTRFRFVSTTVQPHLHLTCTHACQAFTSLSSLILIHGKQILCLRGLSLIAHLAV